jgi:glyoxylase-like metal-dependent hydrolase (beta-lactamase superfamily II)
MSGVLVRCIGACAAILFAAAGGVASSVNTLERSSSQIAEDVHVIRHPDAPDGFPQGNTTVIIGQRGVLVVDSCYLPSSAQQDVDQIRHWTSKPVRFLVNTHWHYDHTMGNATYAREFPEIAIIAHQETLASMRGYNPDWFKRYRARVADLRKQIDDRRGADGKPLTAAKRTELSEQLKGRSAVQAEFGGIVDRLPDVTFDHELTLDLGGREVRLLRLGRGNTAGDVVVYLPKEKIVVTGDLLDYPVPYLGGGYPTEEIDTLKSMERLDTQTIVPGHGEILHDKAYLNMVTDFLETVTGSVQRQIFRLGSGSSKLEEVRAAVLKDVDFHAWRQRFAGDDKDNREFFDSYSMPELITTAYDETWRR